MYSVAGQYSLSAACSAVAVEAPPVAPVENAGAPPGSGVVVPPRVVVATRPKVVPPPIRDPRLRAESTLEFDFKSAYVTSLPPTITKEALLGHVVRGCPGVEVIGMTIMSRWFVIMFIVRWVCIGPAWR